jgi:hypothetical protein
VRANIFKFHLDTEIIYLNLDAALSVQLLVIWELLKLKCISNISSSYGSRFYVIWAALSSAADMG